MATVWEREQIAKKDAKKSKASAAKQEKDAAQQAKVNEEFNEKKTAASSAGDPVAQLKAWCQKPPYLDLTNDVKVSLIDILSFCCNSDPSCLFETQR